MGEENKKSGMSQGGHGIRYLASSHTEIAAQSGSLIDGVQISSTRRDLTIPEARSQMSRHL